MTRLEFGIVMNYLRLGIGKELTADALEVYFDLLGDLDKDVLQAAARRVVLEHKWATFPSIAELRQAAVEAGRGEVKELSAAEAWGLAWTAAAKIDPEVDGSIERGLKSLPDLVREAVMTFGINDLCYGDEPMGVLRGQFVKVYEQLAARDRRAALLPPATHAALTARRSELNGPVRQAIAGIGLDVPKE